MHQGTMVTASVRLVRLIGVGGMGSVWLAEHLGLGCSVAVKFISTSVLSTLPSALGRFQQEATAAARIKSPHVVQMLDHGVMDDGTPFLVMEYLSGPTLEAILDQRGFLSPAEALEVLEQACRALDHAHGLGIIHRDIKPANVVLERQSGSLVTKVLDFGIAKQSKFGRTTSLTNTGSMLGTPNYMSPEQIIDAKHVDRQADLWALAVLTYEMLTGVRPFEGPTVGATIVAVTQFQYKAPSHYGASPAIDRWIERAFHRTPSQRFTTADDMARCFKQCVEDPEHALSDKIAVSVPLTELSPDSETELLQIANASPPTRSPDSASTPTNPWSSSSDKAPHNDELSPPAKTTPETFGGASAPATQRRAKRWPRTVPSVAALSVVSLLAFIGYRWSSTDHEDEAAKAVAHEPTHPLGAKIGPAPLPDGMVHVQAGRYTIGCREGSKRCFDDEKPAHTVNLAAFGMMIHEVTVGQYLVCVEKGACPPPGKGKHCTAQKQGAERYPITCIDWSAADAYCSHHGYMLPTEQQWEVAAVGTQSVNYPWGNAKPNCGITVIADEKGEGCGTGGVLPVGARVKDVSWVGVMDLGGNVREWVRNPYEAYPGGHIDEIEGPDSATSRRVNRGASWVMKPGNVSTSHTRGVDRSTQRRHDLGFRCVVEMDERGFEERP